MVFQYFVGKSQHEVHLAALFAGGCLLKGPRVCRKPLQGLVCWLQHWPERITVCLVTGKWVTWKTWHFQMCRLALEEVVTEEGRVHQTLSPATSLPPPTLP